MSNKTRRLRSIVTLAVLGAIACVGVFASPAAASVNREQLEAHGWTCVPHPFAAPTKYRCFDPGRGPLFPGNPDPRPSYSYLDFAIGSGAFIGTGHIIRQDLYNGQPCGPSGAPYVFLPLAGYYDCAHQ